MYEKSKGEAMKHSKIIAAFFTASLVLTSCASSGQTALSEPAEVSAEEAKTGVERYTGMSAKEIVATLTLDQKAAQMVEGAYYNVSFDEMKKNDYGSSIGQEK